MNSVQFTMLIEGSVPESQLSDMIIMGEHLNGDNVSLMDNNGEDLEVEVYSSTLKEVVLVDEEGEGEVLLSNLAQVSYFEIDNKSFEYDDMIRIEAMGDFAIVISDQLAFLYNAMSRESIKLESSMLQCIKIELLEKHPTYIVLKKKVKK